MRATGWTAGDLSFREKRPGGERDDETCSFDCIVCMLPVSYIVACIMLGGWTDRLNGDGQEDTAEGLFVLLRIFSALRVGFSLSFDSGDDIAVIAGGEAIELSTHFGGGFPCFHCLQGGLRGNRGHLTDWIAVNVHVALLLFELFPSFRLTNCGLIEQSEDQFTAR
jgi:hypothetical protein